MSQLTTLRTTYKEGPTTDSQCVRIELQDGTILRYTDSQLNLIMSNRNVDGVETPLDETVTYNSLVGLDLSAVGSTSEASGVVDLEGILIPLGYTREQIASGVFDKARVFIFLTNYNRPVEDEEKLFTGYWGETTTIDGRYVSKFTSLLSVFEVDTRSEDDIYYYLWSISC